LEIDRVNETLWTTVGLKITFQATNFIKEIMSFLAYGESSIAKTLNQPTFHMRPMARFEFALSADVGGLDFGG
jgi:hypothetical protein